MATILEAKSSLHKLLFGTASNVDTAAAGNALQGRSYYDGYDSIGNRTATTTNGQSSDYATNGLNQIISRDMPGTTEVAGFAASSASVTVASQPTTRQLDYFYRQRPLANTSGPAWANLAISATLPGARTPVKHDRFIWPKPWNNLAMTTMVICSLMVVGTMGALLMGSGRVFVF